MMIMLRRRKKEISMKQSRNSGMSSKTRDFIQKICYKKTASVDMTQYGFISDSRVYRVHVQLMPLREQLDKICGKTEQSAKNLASAKGCKKSNKSGKDEKDCKTKQKHSSTSSKQKRFRQ